MAAPVPITVGIPTWARGERVLATIERVLACDPRPAEVIVHVDASGGTLERTLAARFPAVKLLSSDHRVGPGGGRHRCVMAATQPYFASFDDDSWPVDRDYFAEVVRRFEGDPTAAVLGATIFHRDEAEIPPGREVDDCVEYTGCGYALRVAAYRAVPGHLDNPIPYAFEETDLAIQLLAAGWRLLRCGSLRVYHDTELRHHVRPEIVAGTIRNVALVAWLRYPVRFFGRAGLQVANVFAAQVRQRRWRGLASGLCGLPLVVWRHRHARRPVASSVLAAYFPRRHRPVARTVSAV